MSSFQWTTERRVVQEQSQEVEGTLFCKRSVVTHYTSFCPDKNSDEHIRTEKVQTRSIGGRFHTIIKVEKHFGEEQVLQRIVKTSMTEHEANKFLDEWIAKWPFAVDEEVTVDITKKI